MIVLESIATNCASVKEGILDLKRGRIRLKVMTSFYVLLEMYALLHNALFISKNVTTNILFNLLNVRILHFRIKLRLVSYCNCFIVYQTLERCNMFLQSLILTLS